MNGGVVGRAYRIVRPEYESLAFTGEGARLYGGRWNSPGIAMVYLAETFSLAVLEVLVHVRAEQVLQRHRVAEVRFAPELAADLPPEELPADWDVEPPTHSTRRIGDEWVRSNRNGLLRVPSAVIPREHNLLLNPTHPAFASLHLGPFEDFFFDVRLLKG